MKRVLLEELKGGEIVARELTLPSGQMIVKPGLVLKRENINRLKEYNIKELYICSEIAPKNTIDEVITEECMNRIETILETYSYCASNSLSEIVEVAKVIFDEVLKTPEMIYNMYLIKKKSDSTYIHSMNVAIMAVLIALHMKLDHHRVYNLAVGALLHDIGLIYIPSFYRDLIYDECTEEQKSIIRKHVITGYSDLEKETWLSKVSKNIILNHHEKENGLGYPRGLSGKKIQLETKIVSVCSEFDCKVNGIFRKREKINLAIDYLFSKAGIDFSISVVQNFIECIAPYPIGSLVQLSNGERGIVIRQNSKMPARPVVEVIKETGESMARNLIEELTLSILDTIDNT